MSTNDAEKSPGQKLKSVFANIHTIGCVSIFVLLVLVIFGSFFFGIVKNGWYSARLLSGHSVTGAVVSQSSFGKKSSAKYEFKIDGEVYTGTAGREQAGYKIQIAYLENNPSVHRPVDRLWFDLGIFSLFPVIIGAFVIYQIVSQRKQADADANNPFKTINKNNSAGENQYADANKPAREPGRLPDSKGTRANNPIQKEAASIEVDANGEMQSVGEKKTFDPQIETTDETRDAGGVRIKTKPVIRNKNQSAGNRRTIIVVGSVIGAVALCAASWFVLQKIGDSGDSENSSLVNEASVMDEALKLAKDNEAASDNVGAKEESEIAGQSEIDKAVAENKETVSNEPNPKIEILYARFGTGNKWVVVTENIKQILQRNPPLFTNSAKGLEVKDPKSGYTKTTIINANVDGKKKRIVLKAGRNLRYNLEQELLKQR